MFSGKNANTSINFVAFSLPQDERTQDTLRLLHWNKKVQLITTFLSIDLVTLLLE